MSVTMHLTQKNEVIINLKDTLVDISRKTKNIETLKDIKKLIRVLNLSDNSENDWVQFTKHFDQVHGDFFIKLNDKHSCLTPRDIRLCAYLRLNLTTKEIAPLMGISIRGVEISRYRIRKKLKLDKDKTLTQYMMEF
jgi:DNA-binding CsgD family transcriptional regulator